MKKSAHQAGPTGNIRNLEISPVLLVPDLKVSTIMTEPSRLLKSKLCQEPTFKVPKELSDFQNLQRPIIPQV